jgi:hypothetical protein
MTSGAEVLCKVIVPEKLPTSVGEKCTKTVFSLFALSEGI